MMSLYFVIRFIFDFYVMFLMILSSSKFLKF